MKANIALGAAALLLAGCEDENVTVFVPYENDLYVVQAKREIWQGKLSGTHTLKDGMIFTIIEPDISVVSVEKGKVERFGRIEFCRDGTSVRVVVWNGEDIQTQLDKYCRSEAKKT